MVIGLQNLVLYSRDRRRRQLVVTENALWAGNIAVLDHLDVTNCRSATNLFATN